MRRIACAVVVFCLGAFLVGCEQKAASSAAPPTPTPATRTTPPPIAPASASLTYAGTYTMQDTAVCSLSITISKQADGYHFTSGGTQGKVAVMQQGAETYLTLLGLKGTEPQIDIEVAWQDTMLVLQNYGNSMNEYTRFGQCDAKYLELVRQR
ncbi:hypothetical protein MTX78_03855 [Hymenobacter tibetensis]|uniref:Lipocalin-like domain-containing protein n=1 Tax=Hymenobacter tibetensis TaxID=497967 RepID=A0ABY4D3E6_9BACT|nr:hypothetical protein [Hymenobacter tibetensis]UOG75734.1 hypothetical protein MTX78_03855 [Hymenobacter tibetensis]